MLRTFASVRCAVALVAISLSTASAFAIPVYDTAGFAGPRFTPNASLEGQDLLTGGPWVITSNANPAQANVRPTVGVGGGQGVEVVTSANKTDTQWYVSKPIAPVSPFNTVQVGWSMSYLPTSVAGLDFGPFFGVEIFDASMGTPKQIGSFGVDASTGELLVGILDGGVPTLATLLDGTTVAAGATAFNDYQISVDYDAQTYSISLNGSVLETNPFLDPTATAFTDAPISTRFVSFNGDQSLNAGTAYFDNYSINVVPEPTMIAGLALFSLGMVRRRK